LIPGIALNGVFTFRSLGDAERLLARRVRSRRTVVLGGGLLGLEAARAMRRFSTEVIVVEHADRLMARQLDHGAALCLQRHVEKSGIEVVVDDAIRAVLGRHEAEAALSGEMNGTVSGVRLRSGRVVECDTLIVAAGITPNISLAVRAGLALGRGIKVDDRMRTSDPSIYAVGECAEHRGRVYGLVAPGFEQAAVAAHCALGGDANYTGSVAATRLKVLDLPVYSIGAVADEAPELARTTSYVDPQQGVYRSVVRRQGRIVGAIAIGRWDELNRVQEAVTARRRVWPWQWLRLRRAGQLWPATEDAHISEWPASAVVCNCTGVTCGQLRGALAEGCASVVQLSARTGASTVCGSCRPHLEALAGNAAAAEPVRGARWLWAAAMIGAVLAALLLLLPGVPYPETADLPWRWDVLWRSSFYKQVSGYALLTLMAGLAALALRKRVVPAQLGARLSQKLKLGQYSGWRVVHTVLGAGALTVLLVHSGGRFGSNLNFALSLCVVGAALFGVLAGGAQAREHVAPALARRVRRRAFWAHVLTLWPLPVLLAFHVIKTYAF
jgi:nitrite reductase (NADH) large subunit